MDQMMTQIKQFALKHFYQVFTGILLFGVALGGVITWGVFCECECSTEVKAEEFIAEEMADVSVGQKQYEVPVQGVEEASEEICVDIAGAVNNPGVYCVEEGSMVIDVLKKAGGFQRDLYASAFVGKNMNLSEGVKDAQKVYFPFRQEVSCRQLRLGYSAMDAGPAGSGNSNEVSNSDSSDPAVNSGNAHENNDSGSHSCVDINSASLDELETLDGVGESTAKSIVEGRPYASVNDLLDVSGIGQSKFESIKDGVCEI